MTDKKYHVRCGDCFWEGPSQDLLQKDGLHYCSKCGREFMQFSLPVIPPTGQGGEVV